MAHAERNVAVDPQMATRTCTERRFALGFVHVGEHAHRAVIKGLALRRELQSPRRPIDQAAIEATFQPGHQLAHARRREPEFARSRCEPAEIDDADKHLHLGGAVGIQAGHDEFIS